MSITTGSKIPTTYLPTDWRIKGAAHFSCSVNLIERVVYGVARDTKRNAEIFEFMLKMAEQGKIDIEREQMAQKKRLEALNQ